MWTPRLETPRSDTTIPSSEDYQAKIARLQADKDGLIKEKDCLIMEKDRLVMEKDRLVMEKEELTASMDRLRREVYQMNQDKSKRGEELGPRQSAAGRATKDASEYERLRENTAVLKRRSVDSTPGQSAAERYTRDTSEVQQLREVIDLTKRRKVQSTSGKSAAERVSHETSTSQQLSDEIVVLKERIAELEAALREAIETDDDDDDDDGDGEEETRGGGSSAVPASAPVHHATTHRVSIASLCDPVHANTPGSAPESVGRSTTDTGDCDPQSLMAKSGHVSMDDYQQGMIPVESVPRSLITITPVIGIDDSGRPKLGQITSLSPKLLDLIFEMLNTLASNVNFHAVSSEGFHGCAERHLKELPHYYTVHQPGCFACRSCFNKLRPCLRAIGGHRWMVLPLSPNTRKDGDGTEWHEVEYFINHGVGTSRGFPGLWQIESKKGKAASRAREAADAAADV